MESPNSEIQLAWPPPPRSPSPFELADDEIHVWSARLFPPDFGDSAARATLSEAEMQRAGMFHFERDRKNFVARRSLLRVILGRYLKSEPSQVPLAYEERGKPRLSGADAAPPLHFNFSHSQNLALLAVGRLYPLGVDVEKIRPMPEMSEIAATFSSAGESARLAAAAPEQKLEVFFTQWTRKEAWLKATGEGIAGNLGQLDCSQPPPGWAFHTLSPAPGFIGALAARAGDARPLCWQWPALTSTSQG
ncbi:MAG: 4'-phosphopantetheinyl transferase superfamily protein [Verrucomicrobiota bacterium]|jgi:4'-phosphopantetheinyl transferase